MAPTTPASSLYTSLMGKLMQKSSFLETSEKLFIEVGHDHGDHIDLTPMEH
jgi:hypothetical protein